MKAVLLMEMPDDCDNCLLHDYDGVGCYAAHKVISCEIGQSKPDWCPLRPLPEKKDICGRYPRTDEKTPSYFIGFNDCLRAIEGSGEE